MCKECFISYQFFSQKTTLMLISHLFFQQYRATLQKSCEANRERQYGWVNWTVAAETPDEVYYQSFYAYGLGWKIKVLDEGEEPSKANQRTNSFITQYLTSLISTLIIRGLMISIL